MKRALALGLVQFVSLLHCLCADLATNKVLHVTKVLLPASNYKGGTNCSYELRSASRGQLQLVGTVVGGVAFTNVLEWDQPLEELALSLQKEFAKTPQTFREGDFVDPILRPKLPDGPLYWSLEVRFVDGRIQQAHSITGNGKSLARFIHESPQTYKLFRAISDVAPVVGELAPAPIGPEVPDDVLLRMRLLPARK